MRFFRKAQSPPPPRAGQALHDAVVEIETRRPATERQRAFIISLAKATGTDLSDVLPQHATIRDASRAIDELSTRVPPTDKQREYVASLTSELDVEARLPADATWGSCSRLIDELVDRHPASEAQTAYLERLCVELGIALVPGEIAGIGKSTASKYIDALVIERDLEAR